MRRLGLGYSTRWRNCGRRRAVGISVSLAAALSIAQVAIPVLLLRVPIFGQLGAKGVIGTTLIVSTTAPLTPILWLIACAVITVSYARRPAPAQGVTKGRPLRLARLIGVRADESSP